MASPCTNDPNEVISAVVGIQTAEENFERELDDAVDTATENADKFDAFVNGTDTQTVQLGEGSPTPTIRNTVRQIMSAASELPNADVSGKSSTANGGSEMRTLAERFGDAINVKDFGAVGDGETDDTAAFAAAETAAAGKAVFIPQGSYNVDASSLAGTYVSDGIVSASGLHVSNIYANYKSLNLFKIGMSITAPVKKFSKGNYLNLVNSGYYLQSVCYDTKRARFVVGECYLSDNSQAGKLVALSDLKDDTNIALTSSVLGGHFNDLDYDAVNDKIYLAPGSSKSKKLVIVDPDTLTIESEKKLGADAWQCASGDGYLYIPQNGVIKRYRLTDLSEDTGFAIEIQPTQLGNGEAVIDQSSFYYNGVYVIIRNVYFSNVTPNRYIRIIYSCYDVDTGNNIEISVNADTGLEFEAATIKNNVLYQLGTSSIQSAVWETLLGAFNVGSTTNSILVDGTDLNTVQAPGVYRIISGSSFNTFVNKPENIRSSCGVMYVLDTCVTSQKIQIILFQTQQCFTRIYNSEGNNWNKWSQPGYYLADIAQSSQPSVSLDDIQIPGLHFIGNISDAPEGVNGFVEVIKGYQFGGGYTIYKQFFMRWGTSGSTDHSFYERLGVNDSNGVTWGSWAKIITSRDSFPNNFIPDTDNNKSLGTSSKRWSVVYAGTGSINTSDARLKENISEPEEKVLKAWGNVGFKIFQFKDAVEEKGEKARLHAGVVAQDVADAFASEGLDANRYALFCYDEWEDKYEEDEIIDEAAVIDEDGSEIVPAKTHTVRRKVQEAGNRYGIRYEEALALECAYQRWLGEKRDARLAELEVRLNEISGNGPAPSGASPDNL